jgi:hypothetical protein
MPRKDFAAFTRLDASDVNTYLMDQSVQTFAGTAARGSAIATPVEGMMTYLEDLDRYDTYNGSSHVPAFGLTLVKSQTIGSAVTSVVVNNAFSADYENYRIIMSGGTASAGLGIRFQLGASTTGYYGVRSNLVYATGGATTTLVNNGAFFDNVGNLNTTYMFMNIDLLSPFLAAWTILNGFNVAQASSGITTGSHQVSTSYSGFTVSVSSGNFTGGTISVYGYKRT